MKTFSPSRAARDRKKACYRYLVCQELPKVEDLLTEQGGQGQKEGVLGLFLLVKKMKQFWDSKQLAHSF